jgi:ankyrin repeat protein
MSTFIAIEKTFGCLEIVRALVAAGGDVNSRATSGLTVLYLASQNGYLEVVRTLLTAGADVNAKANNNGMTALIMASYNGHLEVVRSLLAAQADVNARLSSGETALRAASQNRKTQVAELLLQHGGRP